MCSTIIFKVAFILFPFFVSDVAQCYSYNFTLPNDDGSDFDNLVDNTTLNSVFFSVTANLSLFKSIYFKNISDLAIIGTSGEPLHVIECSGNNSGFSFNNVQNLTMKRLKFIGCGMIVKDTNTGQYSVVKSVIHIARSHNIEISHLFMSENNGLAIRIVDTWGVNVSYSIFRDNKMKENETELFQGGGGIHIEQSEYLNEAASIISHSELLNAVIIENCQFDGNILSIPWLEDDAYSNIEPRKYIYGSGGGLLLSISNCTVPTFVSVRGCTFRENEAMRGGGVAIDTMYNSNVTIILFNCTLEKNSSPKYGGGGMFVNYVYTLNGNKVDNNLLVIQDCWFLYNKAEIGGGVQLLGESLLSDHFLIDFVNCSFKGNEAKASAAVDITRFNQSIGLIFHFTQCEFIDNKVLNETISVSNSSAREIERGYGTFVILHATVYFIGQVIFRNNTGTALYIISGEAIFVSGIMAIFVNNEGYNGGALCLISSSLLSIEPNTTFNFTHNSALNKGGAIFSLNLIGLHRLHRNVVTTCFIAPCEDCRDNVSFYFSGNTAGHGTQSTMSSNVLFSDNLRACLCDSMDLGKEDYLNLFSCYGTPYFFDDGENCNSGGCSLPNSSSIIEGLPVRYNIINAIPIIIYPGIDYNLSVRAFDELGSIVESHFTAGIKGESNASVDHKYKYPSNGIIKINSNSVTDATLVLNRHGFHDNSFLEMDISVFNCPPGFILNDGQCICSDDKMKTFYEGIICISTATKIAHGMWIGYDIEEYYIPENLYTSLCPMGYCRYNDSISSSSQVLPKHPEKMDTFICESNRTGRICGECIGNSSVYFHSPQFTCKPDRWCQYGVIFYILAELLPVTIAYIIVMVSNVSFTSGSANGFIFFAQVIDSLAINSNGINGLNPTHAWSQFFTKAFQLIYNVFNLEFFDIDQLSFCIWRGAGTLDVLVMKYATIVYIFLLIFLTVSLMNRFPRCCSFKRSNRKSKQSYLIHGLSTFLILCYVLCVRISFRIIYPTFLKSYERVTYMNHRVVFYNGNLMFLRGKHLYYAIPALVCVVFIVVISPLILLCYPLYLKVFSVCGLAESKFAKYISIPFIKMKPFLDAFQSCYKDNFRFMSGLFFVYRVLILLSFAVAKGYGQFYLAVNLQLIIMIVIHFIMLPYRDHNKNIADLLVFSNLLAINTLSLYRLAVSHQHDESSRRSEVITGVIQLVLIYLPVMAFTVHLIIKTILAAKQKIKIRRETLYGENCSADVIDDVSYDYRDIRLASFN